MTGRPLSKFESEKLAVADDLIDVVDELDVAINILHTALVALRNPEVGNMFEPAKCWHALEYATDLVVKTQSKANDRVFEIRGKL